jgi:hypothetical protein
MIQHTSDLTELTGIPIASEKGGLLLLHTNYFQVLFSKTKNIFMCILLDEYFEEK